ncbi:MAG: cytochrome C oxidase subunit IV family protein [Armatimonadota bacterium]|nr:cytochrome C oxidase subunit IV family protein [Armatimonadota bacterium]MDR5676532.1 cytochrome C oxidase subunit IV family protein [Armatimonadota bacterium]MDR5689364.1 cytochrome C oxidase subunit IV family protein [Armatimonadota bacterium]MDR7387714.1 cytochrome C oxidase subunit IV family protein [Armatimonadota bacterium]MDR7390237.1 cytochrome C oxidase subunit IV family protein [Armatimonadota bacterium]
MSEHKPAQHGYGIYGVTWFWLLVVTVAEIGVTLLHIPRGLLITSLVVLALIKAALIMAYFMHLRWERPVVATLFSVPVALLLLALFVALALDAQLF